MLAELFSTVSGLLCGTVSPFALRTRQLRNSEKWDPGCLCVAYVLVHMSFGWIDFLTLKTMLTLQHQGRLDGVCDHYK